MTEPKIRFEEPPARQRGPRPSASSIVRQLKEKPGEWAIIRSADTRLAAYAMAYQIRHGVLASYRPAGAFEAKGRTVDNEYRVYARYLGTEGETA